MVFQAPNKTLAPTDPFLPAQILGLYQSNLVMSVMPITIIVAVTKGFNLNIITIIATLETVLVLQQTTRILPLL